YTNYSDGTSATTSQVGNYAYTNFSDGSSATTSRVGNVSHTNYSDGSSSTTTRVGGSTQTSVSGATTGGTSTSARQPRPQARRRAPPRTGCRPMSMGRCTRCPPGC